jgi:hypothetical protein
MRDPTSTSGTRRGELLQNYTEDKTMYTTQIRPNRCSIDTLGWAYHD